MNLQIKRRRFGKIAIASAATTVITSLADKTIAQQSNNLVYGFSLTNKLLNKVDILELANFTPEIVITAINLVTGKEILKVKLPSIIVNNANSPTEIVNQAVFPEPRERLTGVTTLSNGKFVISSVVSAKNGNANRFILVDVKSLKLEIALKFSGFPNKNSTVENILKFKNNQLLSVISLYGGTQPLDLIVIDIVTGKVTTGAKLALPELPSQKRFSNLSQAADGKIYATNLDTEGVTRLVQLDLDNKAIVTGRGKITKMSQLQFNQNSLATDLLSLVFSQSGQLFALANIDNNKNNSLFTVNLETGEMRSLGEFPFDKIAFAR